MLSKYVWENIAQENYLCNVDPERSDTLWQENNLYNVVLICLYQHWTRKLPVQCWSKAQEQLCNFVWANIAQGNHLCNVCPWLTDNFYEENNLYNVASTMLRQYYIGILSVQCCPNTCAQENYLYNVGTERTAIILKENNLHNFVLLCLGQDCTKQ